MKMKTSNKMLIVSVAMIILFTVVAIVLQFQTSVELSSTLITCWYVFWTAEIFSIAGIKVSKVKHNYDSYGEEDIEDEEEAE